MLNYTSPAAGLHGQAMQDKALTAVLQGCVSRLAAARQPEDGTWQRQACGVQVQFDTVLDMQPFLAQPVAGPINYELYGIIVHQGHTSIFGHYIAYVRASNGLWYKCNDSQVVQVCSSACRLLHLCYHPATAGA